ncbi:hypothetical protein CDAR_387921 [Caerostris darwini]|uniref:Uncharacterized protein n=1 Tax=Caerostris darwini TaxID=1538125 RepID=A0AAV4SUI5_9ARAC|nr:hypothetical protein CDAR_387921 [Caerostris darwini]
MNNSGLYEKNLIYFQTVAVPPRASVCFLDWWIRWAWNGGKEILLTWSVERGGGGGGGGPLVRGHRPGAGGDGLRLRQVDAQLFCQLGVVLLVDVVEHAAARHLHLQSESLGDGSERCGGKQWNTPSLPFGFPSPCPLLTG